MPLTACTIQQVLSTDNPNEGRVKINNNFECLQDTVTNLQIAANTGTTIVSASTNINVSLSYSGSAPVYSVGVTNNPLFSSLSASSYFVGSASLESYLTGSSVFTSGSSGSYSIKANNDSGLDATGDYSYVEGKGTIASGESSHAEGRFTVAGGLNAHAEGYNTSSTGINSHAEGGGTTAEGDQSHAEGDTSMALGTASHAEGQGTTAIGNDSHSEGTSTIANGTSSHAEGFSTTARGEYSHSEGSSTTAFGDSSHAEGGGTISNGISSHSEGDRTIASGDSSHAEGSITTAIGASSHSEGLYTTALGIYSHAEGGVTTAIGDSSHSEGGGTQAIGENSHAEGFYSIASGSSSHAEGNGTTSVGLRSHAEGDNTKAFGIASHTEGANTTATGTYSHSEGYYATSIGNYSHAEGSGTTAKGESSHAEGESTIASGASSHAEGNKTTAIGISAHAEGYGTTTLSNYSHAEGFGNIAIGVASHVGGSGNTVNGLTSFVHSQNSLLTGDRSVLLGGASLTGTSSDTVYVPYLNVKNLYNGTPSASLAIDANGNILSAASMNLGRVLFVSPTGSDSTGEVGNLNKPWRNLYSAKSASTSGDTIYVLPGTWTYDNRNSAGNPYNGQVDTLVNLWKNGVTYYFSPNTKIVLYNQTVSGSDMYLFRPSGVTYETCTVLGYLEYEQNSTGADTSNGTNYYFYGAPISTDTGYTFYSETKTLKSNHCEVLRYGRNVTGSNITRITIKSDYEEWSYLGGQSSSGGFYRVDHTGTDTLEFKAHTRYRKYGAYYPFYISTNTYATVNIYGDEIYNSGNNLFILRNQTGTVNCSVKRIYYTTAYTPFSYFGAIVSTQGTGGWTANIDADLLEVGPNSYTTGIFYLTTTNNTLNFKGNITTNTIGGTGRFIAATTQSGNVININGDINLIGTATTTNVLFQPNAASTINYTGKITGSFGGPIVKTYNGIANINNSFIQFTTDNASAQVFQNGASSSGTCRINSSYIEMRNNTNPIANGSYVKALINNSTIINTGTGTTLSNTTNFGTLQMINSTIITSGSTSVSYLSAGTPVISSNSVTNANYSIASAYGTFSVINELTY